LNLVAGNKGELKVIKPIGIFDSGVGGLTVAREIMAVLPERPIVYYGDCLRVPYGERTPEDLTGIARGIIDFLLGKDIGALVVACGTISSSIFDTVKGFVPLGMPVMGMVEPGVRGVLEVTKNNRIGIIATEGSVRAKGFESAILQARPKASVTAVTCPLFAYIVEEGWVDNAVSDEASRIYMEPFRDTGIDTLLLGCTHYPLLAGSIGRALPEGVQLVDPAVYLAKELARELGIEQGRPVRARAHLSSVPTTVAGHKFYVSARQEKFDRMAKMVLGIDVKSVLQW